MEPSSETLQQRSQSEVFSAHHFAGFSHNEVTSSSQQDLSLTDSESFISLDRVNPDIHPHLPHLA